MIVKLLKSKIHDCFITDHNVNYEGSILINKTLMEAAGFLPNEKVHVLSVTSGERLETYVIEGNYESQDIVINGAAAHKIKTGEKVIIVSYALFTEEEANLHIPTVVYVDEGNNLRIK
ncbi:MAG: aspartate 1-decarboxylase [Candidatus Actinomarina sp.]|jgi:aspartate 1-decarboxylase|nr:aspartate 1-decarboxylase [Candidatus Actinomarina sp.]